MYLADTIKKNNSEFLKICDENSVNKLYAFGSSVTGRFDQKTSDIDLFVILDEPNPIERGGKLMALWNDFEKFFDRKIDLLTVDSVKNPVLKKNIDRTKILIYDRKGQKVPI